MEKFTHLLGYLLASSDHVVFRALSSLSELFIVMLASVTHAFIFSLQHAGPGETNRGVTKKFYFISHVWGRYDSFCKRVIYCVTKCQIKR